MATRVVNVVLQGQNNLSPSLAAAAISANRTSGSLQTLGNSARDSDRSINTLTGRLGLLASGLASLGPAAIPVGAVAIPAVVGLSAQVGAAALGVGVLVAAFQGVGDTLTAVNEAALEPTAENIQVAREALESLSPAAAEFVGQLQQLRPELEALRDTSAEGFFPGASDGLDALITRLPQFEAIFANVSATSGDLARDMGEALASGSFDDFFDMLQNEAPRSLDSFARSAGNIGAGLADIFVAFGPLTQEVDEFLLTAARGFRDWASGLSESNGFSEFVQYVRTNGPRVADTAMAIGDALVGIVTAAAPLGGPALQAIEAFATAVDAVAESDLGTPIMAGVAAMGLLTLASRAYRGVAATSFGAATIGSVRGMVTALTTVTTAQQRATMTATQLAAAQTQRTAAVASGMRTLAGGAAVLGAVAVASSGAGDSLGVTNTATLALIGTMAGPFGAAAGAMIGATIDAAKANDQFTETLERAQAVTSDQPTAFRAQTDALADARAEMEEFLAVANGEGWGFADEKNQIEGLFGKSDVEEAREAYQELRDEQDALRGNYSAFVNEVNGNSLADAFAADYLGAETARGGFIDYTRDLAALEQQANSLVPKLQAVGYTTEDIAAMKPYSPEWNEAVEAVQRYVDVQDSLPGRAEAVASALSGIGQEALTASEAADALRTSLDALLGPGLELSEATDAYESALRGLNDALSENTNSLVGFGEGAVQNRDVIRDLVGNTTDLLVAQRQAGASGRELRGTFREGVDDIMAFGTAAGLSRVQLRGFLTEIGFTPKVVRTIMQTPGMDEAATKARNLVDRFNELPKTVRTELAQRGFPQGVAEVEALTRKYNLTPKQVETILKARDNASVTIDRVTNKARAVPSTTTTTLFARDNASGTIASVAGRLAALNGDSATTYLRVVRTGAALVGPSADGNLFGRTASGNLVQSFASGGFARIGDQPPQLRANSGAAGITWSEEGSGPWEAFISGHPAKTPRSRQITEEVVTRLGGDVMWRAADGALLDQTKALRTQLGQPLRVVTNGATATTAEPSRASRPITFGDLYAVDPEAMLRLMEQRQRDANALMSAAS